MASSSEVMELDVPPPEEDSAATSDAGGGAAIPCWAEKVEATKSTHDREEILRSLCRRYRIREEEYRPFCAKEGWGPCKTMPEGSNAVCVYEDMLEAGVRFPLHDFYAEYLRHYSIAPSQLTPNAWRYLVGFLLLCDSVGVQPAVAVFRHYFKMCAHGFKLQGWYYLVPFSQSRRLFKTASDLPANTGWKKRFFFLESLSPELPWRCPERWGTPKPGVCLVDPVLTDAERTAISRLEAEKAKRDIPLMELLHKRLYRDTLPILPPLQAPVNAGAAASTPSQKRKCKALSSITPPQQLPIATESSTPPDLATPDRPSRADGGEHSASQILMDSVAAAYKVMQRTEEELHNAKDELREERAKHAEDVAAIKEELGAARAEHMAAVAQLKKELQTEKAKCADVVAQLEDELGAAKTERMAEVAELSEKLQAAKAEQATMVAQLVEEREAAEAEHEAKVRQLMEDLQATQAEHAKALGVLGEVRAELKVLWAAQGQHKAVVRQLSANLQAAKAEHATMVGRLTDEREAADAEHKAKVRQLMEELIQAPEAKHMAMVRQFTEGLHVAEAEHASKVLQLTKELQEGKTEHRVIDAEHTSGTMIGAVKSERYDMQDVPPGFPPRQAPAHP